MAELRDAANEGDEAKVEAFLVDKSDQINAADEEGYTALHLAAVRGHGGVVRFLLAAGANPSLGVAESEAGLMSPGGGSDASGGKTALHMSAEWGHVDVAKMLMAAGASPLAEDSQGETPQNVAEDEEQEEVIALFAEFVKDPEAAKVRFAEDAMLEKANSRARQQTLELKGDLQMLVQEEVASLKEDLGKINKAFENVQIDSHRHQKKLTETISESHTAMAEIHSVLSDDVIAQCKVMIQTEIESFRGEMQSYVAQQLATVRSEVAQMNMAQMEMKMQLMQAAMK